MSNTNSVTLELPFNNVPNDEIRVLSPPTIAKPHVMRSAFVETYKWQEFHANGQLNIDGEIAVIAELSKGLYDWRDGWYDCRNCDDLKNGKYFISKGIPVCRIGVWSCYFDNGQLAWQIDYGDGMLDIKIPRQRFPSYRKDGTLIARS